MQFKKLLVAALSCAVLLSSCDEDEPSTGEPTGTLTLKFDNFVGTENLQLSSASDTTTYRYTNENNQGFNVTKFGYYITNVTLKGPDGEMHLDPVVSSADADKVKGFYLVTESNSSSRTIVLTGVPEDNYNEVSFDVGIPEESVTDGAQGGVLDIAGGWFWTWNSGYTGLKFEGLSDVSGAPDSKELQIHIGGWKTQGMLVNNVKTVTLPFDRITVEERLSPKVHIVADLLKLINMSDMDFTTDFSVHSQVKAQPYAVHLPHIFSVEHVHAN